MNAIKETESRRFLRLNDNLLNILNDRSIITNYFPFN